ncbi:hypothetical protein WNY63_20450 [Pseudoalteromonas neustonica]|uniref:Uncharacterized protein n=1 Tax=Pseudoalteromonas neustonica TaxID=1840331 RepID=A0ABU9U984_9GAMM
MAKSPITLVKINNTETKLSVNKTQVSSLNMPISFKIKGKKDTEYNLVNLCYHQESKTLGLAKINRTEKIFLLYKLLLQKKKSDSDETVIQFLAIFRRFVSYCDSKKVCPFSLNGYLSYIGNNGELWRLVNLYNKRKRNYYEYNDGAELGIKESSAKASKVILNSILLSYHVDIAPNQDGLSKFKGNKTGSTKPYTKKELDTALRRINHYFQSLSEQLISYKKNNPIALPPQKLEVITDIQNNEVITQSVGSRGFGPASPFNQCMCSGYLLFCYYTAFNKSSITELRHPIINITSDKLSKTSPSVKVKAYKGRSHSAISALFLGDETGNTHPNLDTLLSENKEEIQEGFITATMDKRDKNGITTGLDFIKILSELSSLYSSYQYGKIFYGINENNEITPLNIDNASLKISENLSLFTDDRHYLADHFITLFNQIQNENKVTLTKLSRSQYASEMIQKTTLALCPKSSKIRSIELAFAAISCMTSLTLRNIIMPLIYLPIDGDNNYITIKFNYSNGNKEAFTIEKKYMKFFKKLEAYAAKYNKLPIKRTVQKNHSPISKPPFLLPLGKRRETKQWQGLQCIISYNKLTSYGVVTSNFLLNLNASRFRLTTSNQEYNESDQGRSARKILTHSKRTQDMHYPDGHPDTNTRMTSQGMQIMEQIADGKPPQEAKLHVQKEQKLEMLTYDEYKRLKIPSNANGIACNGQPEFVEQKDYHYTARKFAEKNSFIKHNEDITCYQLDLCPFCKSAKLVDDPHSVYKLLSFIEAIKDSISLLPERAEVIIKKANHFELLLEDIPSSTLELAVNKQLKQGRYFLFKQSDYVLKYLLQGNP